MSDGDRREKVEERLRQLEMLLRSTLGRAASMIGSGVEAGEARSLELLHGGIDTALANLTRLCAAVSADDRDTAHELSQELGQHVNKDIARHQILSDLKDVVQEAEEEQQRRVGRHRNAAKAFIENGKALETDIAGITSATDLAVAEIDAWASEDLLEETDMAHKDDNLKAIETAIQQLGRQLSFLAPRSGAIGTPTSSGSAGAFKTVTAQMTATLDTLGMPHHGVQFSDAKMMDMSRDTLIERLMEQFQETERNGNKAYTLGEGVRTATSPADDRLLAGAAKSAARRVRAEADNILDILDRLPDMTRFRTRSGVVSADDARKEVEDRFVDLDEVMADPFGVNFARACFALRRIFKALLDYFDYANLEPEFVQAVNELEIPQPITNGLILIDVDELSQRRTPTQSEELVFEIKELAQALYEMIEDVWAPLSNERGNAAARLELSLTSAHGSARDLRDLLVRTGTSLAEQDLIPFTTQVMAAVQAPEGTTIRWKDNVKLNIGQVMDWIIEVAEPFTGASFRTDTRERRSLAILAGELCAQALVLKELIEQADKHGFSLSLPGPMRQLEELKFLIDTAAAQASLLAGSSTAKTG